jgi:hypothetical protein
LADNGQHSRQKSRAAVAPIARVTAIGVPAGYAGYKCNPMEKIWWQLKDAISANRSFKVLADLDAALRYFAALTPQAILRMINSHVARQAQAAVTA